MDLPHFDDVDTELVRELSRGLSGFSLEVACLPFHRSYFSLGLARRIVRGRVAPNTKSLPAWRLTSLANAVVVLLMLLLMLPLLC